MSKWKNTARDERPCIINLTDFFEKLWQKSINMYICKSSNLFLSIFTTYYFRILQVNQKKWNEIQTEIIRWQIFKNGILRLFRSNVAVYRIISFEIPFVHNFMITYQDLNFSATNLLIFNNQIPGMPYTKEKNPVLPLFSFS